MLKGNARIGVGRDGMPPFGFWLEPAVSAGPQTAALRARSIFETTTPAHVMEVKKEWKGSSIVEEMGEEREGEEKRGRDGSSDKQGGLVLAVNNKRLLVVMLMHPHMHDTQQLCLITGK
jgi:hypothetical protein